MIPKNLHDFLQLTLSRNIWEKRLISQGPLRFVEFGPLDVERLLRMGITVDRLGPRLVVCMWDEKSDLEIGGFLVVDNLAMGQPAMGGTRFTEDITPDTVFNLARGMTLKNAAADLPFGGGKSGIIAPENLDEKSRSAIIQGFGRLLNRYRKVYIPGPDVGTNDADMKIFAIENGLNNVVSKPEDMGGNRIDELGGAANGVVVATRSLLEHLPRLKQLPQFRQMEIPSFAQMDVLIQGFGAVGAHVARLFNQNDPDNTPVIKGISDETGYLLNPGGLPLESLFNLWKAFGTVTRRYFHDQLIHQTPEALKNFTFSNAPDKLLTESAFCMIPASPVPNYLDTTSATCPSMTTDRMGAWHMIVEGANTYSPNPEKKAARRRMERQVFRDNGILIATDYLVNSGGVIYAAHERIIPTPDHLLIPKNIFGDPESIERWLEKNKTDYQALANERRKAAITKLETIIPKNMKELIDGLVKDTDSLPCEVAEQISIQRIASKEQSRRAKDIMEGAPTISVDKSIADAAELLVNAHVPIVNVVSEKGKLIGIVTDWDITRAMAVKLAFQTPLTHIMTADVITGNPDDTILECVRKLETSEFSAMPIVDGDQVLGVISGDILARKTLFRLLQTLK